MVVVVLIPEEVKRQLATATVAKARTLEIGRKMIEDHLYNPPDLDALNAWAEIVMLDLFPLGEMHRTWDDGTKVWLSEAERWHPPSEKSFPGCARIGRLWVRLSWRLGPVKRARLGAGKGPVHFLHLR